MTTEFPEAPVINNQPDRSLKLEDFAYLWKLDDPDWVAQRESDWDDYVKPVFKDHPKEDVTLLENYFKFGKKKQYYPSSGWFFLTPYESKEDLLKLMSSSLVSGNEKRNLVKYYLTKDFYRFSICPWYRSHMELFRESYFSSGFSIIIEERSKVSPPPSSWSSFYVENITEAINAGSVWCPVFGFIDYFLSALPYVQNPKFRKRINLADLMQLVDEKLNGGQCEGELLQFLQELKSKENEIWAAWEIGEQKIAAGLETKRE